MNKNEFLDQMNSNACTSKCESESRETNGNTQRAVNVFMAEIMPESRRENTKFFFI